MSQQLYKFNKNTFATIDYIILASNNVNNIVVTHTLDCEKSIGLEIPFTVSGAQKVVPHINDPEYCIVLREKVDFTAIGVDDTVIKDINEDLGHENHTNESPYRPVELPAGFIELKGKI